MNYTSIQIENAKRNYTNFLKLETIKDHNIEVTGWIVANQRMEYHNKIVNAILNGDKELEKQWKLFFLNEEVKKDRKIAESKAKLEANKSASNDILAPIKSAKKLVEFGKWLNTKGNKFRNQHFSKKYTIEAVNLFLSK
jgi:hypothetical protein